MITRRDLLKGLGAMGTMGTVGLPSLLLPREVFAAVTPFSLPLNIPPVLTPSSTDATTDYYNLNVGETYAEIIPGLQTRVISFNGAVPGPTIRARAGRKVAMTHYNGLPATTLGGAPGKVSIHLHGAHCPASEDGYPTSYIQPGNTRTYTYPNNQLPAPLWYHDHAMDYTGPHVWYGMAGLYLMTDDYEDALNLPKGSYEIPLVIQDRNFDANGQLVYTKNMMGETGNTMLVNGTIQPYLNVAKRKYRFRVYNGSNARFYKLALSNGQSFQVIGMEGGLLSAPVTVTSLTLAPAERADLIINFGSLAIGTNVELRNTLVGSTDAAYKLMQFKVNSSATDTSVVPSTLRTVSKFTRSQAVRTRNWTLAGGMMGGMWTINGLGFDENRVDAKPRLNDIEIWKFTNQSNMDHPIHLHDVMFQILTINGRAPAATHAGWKDTVIVPRMMGTAEIIMKFTDYTGKFPFHCHVLEHEDMMMMSQFEVTP
ncbi:MAG: multicopper oxidase domain-containing protein [Gammaproteobacteria bacterium]|nr:multicopper oxidase domain-containing protein [Gammaproteobacteria bacterium]